MLKSDRDGFLTGDPITIDRGSFDRAIQIWREIGDGVDEIRKALTTTAGITKTVRKQQQAAERIKVATPARAARVAPVERAAAVPARARGAVPLDVVSAGVVVVPERGARGRFVSKGEKPGSSGAAEDTREPRDEDPREPGRARAAAAAMAESVKSGVSEAMSGADQVDPALTAAKEVGGMVGPLLAPIATLGKGLFSWRKDKESKEAAKPHVPWYKRILKQLKKNEDAGGGGSVSSWNIGGIAGLLAAALPAIGGALMAALPALVAVGGVLIAGGIGWAIGKLINDKWGLVISDAIWDASEWIKEKWGGAADWFTTTWSVISTKVTSWIDGLLNIPGNTAKKAVEVTRSVASSAKNTASSIADGALGLIGKGSKGNRAALLKEMDAQGITDPNERAMFLAQADHESGGFRRYEENLNYSAQGLRSTFGKYYKTDAEAQADAGNPEAIANKVYGGRLGNKDPGDGYKFRGRGALQITGRANYAAAGKALGLDLENNPDLLSDPDVAAKAAAWYWKSRGISGAAQRGDVSAVTRKINGGLNGLADRDAKFDSYRNAVAAGGFATAPQVPMSPQARSAAPALDKLTPSPMPAIPTLIGSNDKGRGPAEVIISAPIGQNLADRAIAQVTTGGIGG